MRLKNAFDYILIMLILAGLSVAEIGNAAKQSQPFPSYGSGSVEVRLFTDYCCSPCREMDPAVEPLLKDLLKKNAICLTLVDVPYSKLTPLYARNFLYAIRENNDPEHALRVRNILLGDKDKHIALKKTSVVRTQPIYDGTEKQDRS